MKFGIAKCAIFVLKRDKMAQSKEIRLTKDTTIRAMVEIEGCKYLGVLKVDNMLHDQTMEKPGKRTFKIVARSKLKAGNLIQAINTWEVLLFRYARGILEWTKQELRDLGT